MRAIIYTRVSADPTGRGKSVQDQERECRAECERNGWRVVEVLTDNDRSATRFATRERPEYRRLQEILRKGDVLVTWEASRAQRDLAAYVALRDLCAERGVLWCYSGKVFDLQRGDDRFDTGLDSLLSEAEAETIRERIMRGHRANLNAGRPHGHVPYGYRIVRDPDTGKSVRRVPSDDQAPILRDAARRILAGESLRSVVADLNTCTDRQWRPSTLRRMLLSPVYAGYRTHKGEIVREGTWEPLWTEDQHERLVALFARRTAPRGAGPKYLLTGIAVCGVCGVPLQMRQQSSVPAAKKRADGKLWFYGCEKGHVGRDRDKMDRAVTEVIVALLSDPDALAKLTKPAPADDYDDDHVEELEKRLAAAADQYTAGKLSLDMLTRVEGRLLPRIEAAQQRARNHAHDRYPNPIVAKVAEAPDPRAMWESLPLEDKRDFIRATMWIVVHTVRSRWELGVEVHPLDRGVGARNEPRQTQRKRPVSSDSAT